MNLKERLERLDSVIGGKQGAREEIISDLRRRLERVTHPHRREDTARQSRPLSAWIHGQEVDTPIGKTFVSQEVYGTGYRHGGILLDQVMTIPSDPVSLVSLDERLQELDFSSTLFLDVETTGLAGGAGTYAFLVGAGYLEKGRFILRQFFLRDFSEERAMLWLLGDLVRRFRFLVTFNGKRFDIPLLETRFVLCQMENPLKDVPNYDLLFPSRRIWRGAFEDCRLSTLESCALDVHRQDDVASEMIPYLYFDYLRSGDGSKVHRVFCHNRMDVLSLVTLASRIHELVHTPQTACRNRWIEAYSLGKLFSQRDRTAEAIECFEDALRICKEAREWEILMSLSLVLKRAKHTERAVSVWKEMASFDGGCSIFPYEELAKFYEHHRRDYSEALKWVEAAFANVNDMKPGEEAALRHRFRRLLGKESGRRSQI